jgi:hypothetical protein
VSEIQKQNFLIKKFQLQMKSDRFARTKDLLSKSGMLGITLKTADLLKRNNQFQTDLRSLKEETNAFVDSVMANPENQSLLNKLPAKQPSTVVTTTALVGDNFCSDFNGIFDLELPNVILAPIPSTLAKKRSMGGGSSPHQRKRIKPQQQKLQQ